MAGANVETLRDDSGGVSPSWKATFAGAAGLVMGPSVLLVMCFAVFTPALRAEFGWNVGDTAIAAMLGALCVAFISPIQGWLCDKFGSRPVMLACFPLFGAALMALSQINGDIRWFYVGYVGATLLALGIWPLSFMRCVSSWFDKRLGMALGVVNVGPGVGGAVMPILVGIMIATAGWRMSFLVSGLAVILIAWPIAYIWLRENPAAAVSNKVGARVAPGLSSNEIFQDRSFWLLMVTFTLLGIISGSILLNQVTILTDAGLSRGAAIAAQSALGISSIFARLITGWLLDRAHVAKLMPFFMVVGAGACWFYTVPAGGALIISAIIIGFIIGAEFDVLGYVIRRYHGLAKFGLVYGLLFGVFQIGSAVGVRGMGIIHNQSGSFDAGLMVLVVMCLVVAGLFAIMGKYRFVPVVDKDLSGNAEQAAGA
jgi:MFS family permease